MASTLLVPGQVYGETHERAAPDEPTTDKPTTEEPAEDQENQRELLQSIDWENIPRLPEPSQQVEEVVEARSKLDAANPSDEAYPAISGCAPLKGNLEILPLVDRAHRAISQMLCIPAEEIDESLSNTEPLEDEVSKVEQVTEPVAVGSTLLRLTLESDIQQDVRPTLDFGLSASISLPQLYRRLSGLAERHTERIESLLESDSVAVAWIARPILVVAQMTDIGFSGYYPFVRVRAPYEQELRGNVGLRLRPEVYWRWDDGVGVGAEWNLKYPQAAEGGLTFNQRIETNETMHDDGDGWAWSNTLAYRHRLRERSTATLRADVSGSTEPAWQAHTVRADLRLRRSVGRPWFYVETEPYLQWLREDDFEFTPGIVFRLEIQLGDYPLRDDL